MPRAALCPAAALKNADCEEHEDHDHTDEEDHSAEAEYACGELIVTVKYGYSAERIGDELHGNDRGDDVYERKRHIEGYGAYRRHHLALGKGRNEQSRRYEDCTDKREGTEIAEDYRPVHGCKKAHNNAVYQHYYITEHEYAVCRKEFSGNQTH